MIFPEGGDTVDPVVLSFQDFSKESKLLELYNTDRLIDFNGNKWKFDAQPLVVPYSVTTHLTHPLSERVHDFWLDWHNMQEPIVRMHMYLGEFHDPSVPYEVRLTRMERWAEAILVYDSIMVDPKVSYTKQELEEMIQNGVLPRPTIVELDSGKVGLRKLFDMLNFPKDNDPEVQDDFKQYIPGWSEFVDAAGSGRLIESWKKLKNK